MRTFSSSDARRVCRDLAWSELASFASVRQHLPARLSCAELSWGKAVEAANHISADSLIQVTLATAAATWCNAHEAGFSDLFLAKKSVAEWATVMLRARESGARDHSFATSGTTGARKIVRHRESLIELEAQAWADHMRNHMMRRGTQPNRVIVLCPVHHIYGFIWGVCLPGMLGIDAVDAELGEMPDLEPGDIVVAVPDQWQWLAGSISKWTPSAIGITSTAPMPASTHLRLEQNGLTLAQIYGSTETGGLAWRTSPTEPYELFGNRERVPGGDGIVQRMSADVTFPMDIQDELSWVSKQRFNLVGRTDAATQVGGHNIQPQWVREQFMQHPGVLDATVRLDPSLTPPRLKAFVVAQANLNRAAFEAAVCEQLPHHAAPASFTYGTELPRNAMGKLSDWAV